MFRHEKVFAMEELYRRPEIIQHKCFQFSYSKFRHSNHRIGAHTCTNHTVPYGTALWGGAVPGTSCQATIAPSLRDISQQALTKSEPRNLSLRLRKVHPPEIRVRARVGVRIRPGRTLYSAA